VPAASDADAATVGQLGGGVAASAAAGRFRSGDNFEAPRRIRPIGTANTKLRWCARTARRFPISPPGHGRGLEAVRHPIAVFEASADEGPQHRTPEEAYFLRCLLVHCTVCTWLARPFGVGNADAPKNTQHARLFPARYMSRTPGLRRWSSAANGARSDPPKELLNADAKVWRSPSRPTVCANPRNTELPDVASTWAGSLAA
jgi:hypothetical protein